MSIEDKKKELAQLVDKKKEDKKLDIAEIDGTKLPSAWKLSEKGLRAISVANEMQKTTHALYASIPLLCQAESCPYAKVCPLVDADLAPYGERCPMEIAMILKKYEEYSAEFGIEEKNAVDVSLIKDLIDYDIQLFRAENKIAITGDFVEDVVIAVDKMGNEISNPQLSQATLYKDKIVAKRFKILELMNSTRKDKAGEKLTVNYDPSTYAAELLSKVAGNRKPGEIIDAEYEEMDD